MTGAYQPTSGELIQARMPSDDLRVSGDGVFATLQGEGVSAGRPSVFLRLQECNLVCGRNDADWTCDAAYTWDKTKPEYWQEPRNTSVGDMADEIREAWQVTFPDVDLTPNLVITGGEPLLQQHKLRRLLPLLEDWHTEIETNGTVAPMDDFRASQINCSPKLGSSGNTLRARRREKSLQTIATFPDHWFKFVIASPEDIEEVKEVVDVANGGDFSRVLLMSAGVIGEDLAASDERLRTTALELGCMTTARNHIYWYGDKRAT